MWSKYILWSCSVFKYLKEQKGKDKDVNVLVKTAEKGIERVSEISESCCNQTIARLNHGYILIDERLFFYC